MTQEGKLFIVRGVLTHVSAQFTQSYYEDRPETNIFLSLDGGSLGGGLGKYP
jgi:Ni,Fe-hydrogenase III small subunit